MMINLVGGRHCSSWSPFLISHRQYYKLLRFNHRILGILTSGFTFNDAGDPITHVSFFFIEPSVRWLNRGWILEITLFLLTRIFENCKVTTITGRSPTPHVWWLDVLRIYYSHLPPPLRPPPNSLSALMSGSSPNGPDCSARPLTNSLLSSVFSPSPHNQFSTLLPFLPRYRPNYTVGFDPNRWYSSINYLRA